MASVADETGLATAPVRPVSLLPPLASPAEAANGLALVEDDWSGAADDPLVPATTALDLATVLHALSDPVRLGIVSQLAAGGEQTCGSLDVSVAKSTCSHHFRVLREAGVIAQRVDGKCRFNRLRTDELELRFPGLLDAVLRANRA